MLYLTYTLFTALGGLVRPISIMKQSEIINAIAVLSGTLDPLSRSKKSEVASEVADKISELVKKIKIE